MAVSSDPRTLMVPDPNESAPLFSDKVLPTIPTLIGFIGVLWRRSARRRPLFSGIHEHVICTSIGLLVGILLQNRYDNYHSVRDAVTRHYIELHPEDFPMPERKKIGEIFDKWTPIR